MNSARRITLVVRGIAAPPRVWDTSIQAANRIIFVDAISMLPFVLDHAAQDVDRLLVDGAATPVEFLELLATLPQSFPGDVVLMRPIGNSFLSTAARAEGRMLYALTATDLEFYLETQGLVAVAAKAA